VAAAGRTVCTVVLRAAIAWTLAPWMLGCPVDVLVRASRAEGPVGVDVTVRRKAGKIRDGGRPVRSRASWNDRTN
jgi:hypothetical protein